MALAFTSSEITNKQYVPSAAPHSARECYQTRGSVAVADTLGGDDLVGLVMLPANCIPTDCTLISTDLDVGTAIIVSVGILDTATTDLVSSSLLISESTVCQAGGAAGMNINECAFNSATWLAEADCPDLQVEKTVALKVTNAASPPAGGTIDFVLCYRSAENGV